MVVVFSRRLLAMCTGRLNIEAIFGGRRSGGYFSFFDFGEESFGEDYRNVVKLLPDVRGSCKELVEFLFN